MKEARCKKCDYSWYTESPMVQVSCPSCGNKVKIRDFGDDRKQDKKK